MALMLFRSYQKSRQRFSLLCFENKSVYITATDVNQSKKEWNALFEDIKNANGRLSIEAMESKHKFMKLDTIIDLKTQKNMISYGMMLNLDHLQELGIAGIDFYSLLKDFTFQKLNKYKKKKIFNLLKWITCVKISDVVHLQEENGDQTYNWLLIVWWYY